MVEAFTVLLVAPGQALAATPREAERLAKENAVEDAWSAREETGGVATAAHLAGAWLVTGMDRTAAVARAQTTMTKGGMIAGDRGGGGEAGGTAQEDAGKRYEKVIALLLFLLVLFLGVDRLDGRSAEVLHRPMDRPIDRSTGAGFGLVLEENRVT